MSDEGEDSDCGERGHLSETPSPPLSLSVPRESPCSARPLELFSSASPLLAHTDTPYLASTECLHTSPETRQRGDCPHFAPLKFQQGTEAASSPLRSRRNVRLEAACDRCDDPSAKWRGRGAATAVRFQHRGQGLSRAQGLPDHDNHHFPAHVDAEFNSQTRQT